MYNLYRWKSYTQKKKRKIKREKRNTENIKKSFFSCVFFSSPFSSSFFYARGRLSPISFLPHFSLTVIDWRRDHFNFIFYFNLLLSLWPFFSFLPSHFLSSFFVSHIYGDLNVANQFNFKHKIAIKNLWESVKHLEIY